MTPRHHALAAGALAGALLLTGCGAQELPRRPPRGPGREDGIRAARRRGRDGSRRAAPRARRGSQARKATPRPRRRPGRPSSWETPSSLPRRPTPPPPPAPRSSPPRPSRPSSPSRPGRAWPRAILAATLDEETNTQFLHVMVSEKPEQPVPHRLVRADVRRHGAPRARRLLGGRAASAARPNGEGRPRPGPGGRRRIRSGARPPQAPRRATRSAVDDPFATGATGHRRRPDEGTRQARRPHQAHAPLLERRRDVPPRRRWRGDVRPHAPHRHDRGEADGKELVLPGGVREGDRQEEGDEAPQPAEPPALRPGGRRPGAAKVIGASELLVSGKGA